MSTLATDGCDLDWIADRSVECADPDTLRKLASARLRSQVARLPARSPFYRRRFAASRVRPEDIRDVDDLRRLPFTVKGELRESQEAAPPFGEHLGVDPSAVKVVYQTSGTSGNPSVIALTAADVGTWRTIGSRSDYTAGIHPHHAVLTTFGAGPFVAGHTHGVLDRIGARRVPVGPGDTDRVILAGHRGLVDTLLGTPSFALHLARACEDRALDPRDLGLRHLVTGGEPGGGIPSLRARLETAFGADVTEAMGLGDISASLYGECAQKDGMHFCGQGLVWVELVDPATGEPIPIERGAVGEPVYTALVREAMPLVRFRSGDIVEIMGTWCGCGRTSFKIRGLTRADDMFIVRGVNVYPSAIQAVVGDFRPAVTGRIRVVLPRDAGVSVPAPVPVEVEVPSPPSEDDLAARIAKAIHERLLFRVAVTFVPSTRFGDAGYKTKPVVRR